MNCIAVDNDEDLQVPEEQPGITEIEEPTPEPVVADPPQLMEPLIPVSVAKEEQVMESQGE